VGNKDGRPAYNKRNPTRKGSARMDMKTKLLRSLSQATCDKTDLNQTILTLKKRFDEANAAIGGKKKKK
jgi:hypothetical protein